MLRYVIKNEFNTLREFALNLQKTFDDIGSTILDNRNVVKKIATPQGVVVVKDFRGMYFFNRLAYTLFTASKAKRSYENSATLREKGIATPRQIGWLDYYRWGLLSRSFFISVYDPYETLRDVLNRNRNNALVIESLYDHLIEFIIKLHRLEVYHHDFSLTNILVIPDGERFRFSLVDLNRVRFRNVGFADGLHNLSKLDIPDEDLNQLIRKYAVALDQSPEEALKLFRTKHQRAATLRKARRTLRRYTLTPLERLFR